MNIPLNIDWQQICLHLLNFAILATGLYFLLYKPVKDFMNKRTEYYRAMEAEAKKKMSDAENAKADYDRRLQEADAEIKKRIGESLRSIEEFRLSEEQQARANVEKILLEAQKEAEKEHDRMIENAQKEVVDMVTVAAKKMLLRSTASEAMNQFLEAAERSVQRE